MLFKERSGEESPAQIKAFTDTWEWTQESERTFEQEIVLNPETQIRTVAELLDGRAFELPPHPSMYQPAQRVEREEGRQAGLEEAG